MKGGSKASGFTVIETLIVLAVSGSMFVGVVLLISGQQGRSQFEQSINSVTLQLQQTIGDVSNGYFPNTNIQCDKTGGPNGKPNLTRGSGSIGTNYGCILVGKVIQFTQTSKDPQQYIVYSMVGLRQMANGQSTTSLKDANPIAIAPGNSPYQNVPDASVANSLTNGLSLAASAQSTSAFAILANPSAISGPTSGASGSQQVSLYSVSNTRPNLSQLDEVYQINNYANYAPVASFTICLASGTNNQSGLITIGGNGRQLAVVLAIKGNKTCS